ncbi:alpha-tocopherol transfer protein-like isoform X1 [Ixodes scapularis]|uniref:alpha-tocopherol transfer protein-like isoform X1 n=1 Tax=Ixodes scapularis TaxID=6945 RepID=UPI001A9E8BF3|nr:alpha-tocopherol transfer protein-like isoform X1 [Ixodes scapularis]
MQRQRLTSASVDASAAGRMQLDFEAIAYEELGETPQLRRDTVLELRKLIHAQSDLRCPSDDAFLVKFLRARKHCVEEAFGTIQKYFRVRELHQDIFQDLLPSKVMFDAIVRQSKVLTLLEERDHLGRLVGVLKSGAWNPEVCSLNEVFRTGVVVGEYCLLDERTQIAGVVGIVDLKGLGFEHVRHYTPSVIKTSIQLCQDCYPMRLKAIYIVNNPPIFEVIYSIAKLFLKQKLVDRIHFIGRDYEKLYELIPRERLPEEYGGTLNNYDFDAFERGLRSMEEFFVELSEYGYRGQEA